MGNGRVLGIRWVADFSGVSAALSKMQTMFSAFGGASAGAVGGIAVAAAAVVVGLGKIGQKFDEAYDTIRAGTGATGKALGDLEQSFKNVVKTTPTDFGKASQAIADVNTRLGLTGKPLEDVTKRLLELSRLTKTDVATNTAAMTRLFGDWSIATEEQAGTLDKVFRASQQTGVGVDDLAQLMVQFGSPLRQLGLDFDTSAAMFARFEKEGVNIQTAMPGLRMALKNFAKEGRDPATALKETIQAIKNTGSVAEANTMAFKVFGVRAGPDLAAAIREGRFDLEELIGSIRGGKDTILGAAADTESMSEKWQIFKNQAMVGLEPLAIRIFDAFTKIVGVLSDWGAKFGELSTGTQQFILAGLGLLVALGPLIAVFSKVIVVIKGVSAALAFLGANPIVLVIAAIVLLAVLIIKNWDKIKAFTIAVWNAIWGFLVNTWNKIKGTALAAFNWLKNIFLNFTPVGQIIKNWDKIKAVLSAIWQALRNTAETVLRPIAAVFGAIRTAIGWVIDKVKAVIGWFTRLNNKIPEWLKPGSPSPLERTLWGTAEAMKQLARVSPKALAGGAVSGIVGGGNRAGGGKVVNLTVNVAGSVITERELAASVRTELLRVGASNPDIFGGRA